MQVAANVVVVYELEQSIPAEFVSQTARHLPLADLPRVITGKQRISYAAAGFYYDIRHDTLICFSCREYKREDPWELHALFFSTCGFLKAEKGQAYIDQISAKYAVSRVPYYIILNEQLEASLAAFKDLFEDCEENKYKVIDFRRTAKQMKSELHEPRLKSGHRLYCGSIDTEYEGCGCFQYDDSCKEAIGEIAVGGEYKLVLD